MSRLSDASSITRGGDILYILPTDGQQIIKYSTI